MGKITKKLLILIVIVNVIVVIIQGTAPINSGTIVTNNLKENDRLQEIQEKKMLTVASALSDVPFFYKNAETNEMRGIDADIINEITRRLGINKVELKEAPFSNLLEKLCTDDSIDMAAGGIYITPEREKIVAFTEPLYKEVETVIVPKFSNINFMNDLKNEVIGVEKGTAYEELAKKWKENKLVKDVMPFENTSDLLNAINNRKINAGVSDSVVVSYFLLNDKNLSLRTLKDYTSELPGAVGIAVRKNDISLLKALNEKIREMKADGTLYAILRENGLDKNNIIQ